MAELNDLIRATGKGHALFTGRATTALYLLLRGHGARDRTVVLPVNIGYSIVNAITMSGNRPRFVDVDATDGIARAETIRRAVDDTTFGVLLPHLYGNRCVDTGAIAELCRERGVRLIEDCAHGFDGTVDGSALGSFGDYVLLSFGARKTLDASLGGLLLAAEPLGELEPLNDELPFFSERLARKTELSTSLFRLVYHSGHYEELVDRLAAFNEPFEEIYRFRLREEELERIHETLAGYTQNRERRLRLRSLYDEGLPFGGRVERYPFAEETVPWRYNLRITSPELRRRIIDALLDAGVAVSAWYPPIHRLFGDDGEYPGATRFAREILNIPVDISAAEASAIRNVIVRAAESRTEPG